MHAFTNYSSAKNCETMMKIVLTLSLATAVSAYGNGRRVGSCCSCPSDNEKCYQVTSSCSWGTTTCCGTESYSSGTYYCKNGAGPTPTRRPTTRTPTTAVTPTTYATEHGTCTDKGPGATSPVFMYSYSCKTMKRSKCTGYDKNGAVAMNDCCACGGEAGDQCTDVGAWKDSSSYTCKDYSGQLNACKDGNVVDHRYAGYGAEENCCACGGGAKAEVDHGWSAETPPQPVSEDVFSVTGKGVEVNGNCFTDGDGNHGSNEDATIEVLKSGWISAVGHFQTEKRYVGRVVRHSARHCVVRHRRSRFPLSLSHPSPLL